VRTKKQEKQHTKAEDTWYFNHV